jgi:hypothetical protein
MGQGEAYLDQFKVWWSRQARNIRVAMKAKYPEPAEMVRVLGVTLGGLTNRWSGRVKDKVPSSDTGGRAAQLNR